MLNELLSRREGRGNEQHIKDLRTFTRRNKYWIRHENNFWMIAERIAKGRRLPEFQIMYKVDPELIKVIHLGRPTHYWVLSGLEHLCTEQTCSADEVLLVKEIL